MEWNGQRNGRIIAHCVDCVSLCFFYNVLVVVTEKLRMQLCSTAIWFLTSPNFQLAISRMPLLLKKCTTNFDTNDNNYSHILSITPFPQQFSTHLPHVNCTRPHFSQYSTRAIIQPFQKILSFISKFIFRHKQQEKKVNEKIINLPRGFH